jgi:DNA-directed RNA polymerase specialized sigma24 family protein
VSELTAEELNNKYPDMVRAHSPYVLLSVAQGQVIDEFKRNENKHRMRQNLWGDNYNYDDGQSERFHPELALPDYADEVIAMQQYVEKCELLSVAMEELTMVQRRRVVKYFVENKSYRVIAKEENVTVSKIEKSIYGGLEKMKKYFEANKTW